MPSREKLAEFAAWCAQHITGDEKGQAQIFLDRLSQAFGQPGCLDVGGATEFRIRKAHEDGGGTAFADYVWKPVVLIEMKRRGADSLKDAHAALDAAVLTAYGFSARKELLAQLLTLNQEVASKIERGEPVTAPGVPPLYPDPKKLVTEDCIQAGEPDRTFSYADPPPAPTHPSLTPEQAYGDAAHYYSGKEDGPPYRTKE